MNRETVDVAILSLTHHATELLELTGDPDFSDEADVKFRQFDIRAKLIAIAIARETLLELVALRAELGGAT